MDPLHAYLRERLEHAYRQLAQSLEGLDEDEARRGADPNWRRERYGTGLDGSISGMVRHLAVWKHVAAEGLRTGAFPDAETLQPARPGWDGLLEWLEQGHRGLSAALRHLSGEDLSRILSLEGQSLPIRTLLSILIEHDHYHAGQVNLLRQLMVG